MRFSKAVIFALALAPSLAFAQAPGINDVQLKPGSSTLWGAAFNTSGVQEISQYNTAGSVVDSFRWYQGSSPSSATRLFSVSPTGSVVGSATGGAQGAGTINATGMYVNGVIVTPGGTPGGSSGQVQYNNAGAFGGISGATSNGTALTLVAPILGTPASGTLTNTTGFPIANLAGAGTGVLTALGVNIGSAGAPILFNGAGGTPSSMTGTNITGLSASNISTGNLAVARLNSGTGATSSTFWRGDGTWASPTVAFGQLTNSLGADVNLNNTANYFDGPSIAQGSTGTWLAMGTVTVFDTAGVGSILCKLWDGTTVIASAQSVTTGASNPVPISLSGFLASPAGNIRMSCRDTSSTNGRILFNNSGNSKDSTVTGIRLQ